MAAMKGFQTGFWFVWDSVEMMPKVSSFGSLADTLVAAVLLGELPVVGWLSLFELAVQLAKTLAAAIDIVNNAAFLKKDRLSIFFC
jgi:hypothetical protein